MRCLAHTIENGENTMTKMTLIRRIIITIGWFLFMLFGMLTKTEQDWRLMFNIACMVLCVQSLMRIGDKE